jgi:hypothetical protein
MTPGRADARALVRQALDELDDEAEPNPASVEFFGGRVTLRADSRGSVHWLLLAVEGRYRERTR